MQFFVKIILTIGVIIAIIAVLVFVCSLISFLYQIWHSEVDVKESFWRLLTRKPSGTDVIAIRDPDKIYQDGKEVGDVTGEVKTIDNYVIFERIFNINELNIDLPFEYRGKKLKITKYGSVIGPVNNPSIPVKIEAPGTGSLGDVVCEVVR